MRLLITGGCGFIGSSFTNLACKASSRYDITVVDKLTYAADPSRMPGDTKLLIKDICDLSLNDIGEVDYIVNFAAESHVDNSISNGLPFIRSNVEGTFNMLELARKMPNLKKFVQISTDEVYGDMITRGLDAAIETTSLKTSSYYSATKAAADHLVEAAGRTYGLPFLITRTCNNFGTHQHEEKFLPTIARCVQNGTPIPLYGDGEQVREWIWVEDNARIILSLMESEQTGIWNIGSGDHWTNREVIDRISNILNKPVAYEHINDREGHDRRYCVDCRKLLLFAEDKGEQIVTKNLKKFLTEVFK